MIYRLIFIAVAVLSVLVPLRVAAQDVGSFSADEIITQIAIYLAEEENAEMPDYELLEERLNALISNPVDINRATRRDLERLPFLDDTEVEALLRYIYLYGPMQSVYELQLVDGLRPLSRRFIIPFISVGDAVGDTSWSDALREASHTLFARVGTEVERRAGYADGSYPGAPVGGMLKYRVQAADRLYAGITLEHDEGEPFLSHGAHGFDLCRAYVRARAGRHVSLFAGDFRASFGRGLLFGERAYGGMMDALGRSGANGSGISHYGGADETDFFRGAGVSVSWGGWRVDAFYSFRYYDADTTGGSFSTLRQGGLHRTMSERRSRHTVGMHTAAVHASYAGRHFEVGLTAGGSYHKISRRLPDNPYYRPMFSGNMQGGMSTDYRLFFRTLRLYGETAVNQGLAVATVNTLAVSPLSSLDIYLNHRYYSPRYDMYFSNAVSSGSRVNDEHGATFGFSLSMPRHWSLDAYADVYRRRWVSYRNAAPSSGWEARCDAEYGRGDGLTAALSARYRFREIESGAVRPVGAGAHSDMFSLRGVVRYGAGCFRFASGAEGKAVASDGTAAHYGMMLAQDVVCGLFGGRMTIACSAILFDADSWDNRFFWYERNLPGSGYSSALYGTGCRWYAMLSGRPVPGLSLGVRIARTWYADGRTSIGSGDDMTQGNHRTDIGAYIQWRL